MPFESKMDPDQLRLLARLKSSAKTLAIVQRSPDRLTKTGGTMYFEYTERFLSAYDAACSQKNAHPALLSQVQALTPLYESLKLGEFE